MRQCCCCSSCCWFGGFFGGFGMVCGLFEVVVVFQRRLGCFFSNGLLELLLFNLCLRLCCCCCLEVLDEIGMFSFLMVLAGIVVGSSFFWHGVVVSWQDQAGFLGCGYYWSCSFRFPCLGDFYMWIVDGKVEYFINFLFTGFIGCPFLVL